MKRYCIIKHSVIKRNKHERLQAGLSYTPSQMWQMTKQGIPVSSDNSLLPFYDGAVDIDFVPLAERCRGVDPASLWNMQQDAKKKAKKAYSVARGAYDSNNPQNS